MMRILLSTALCLILGTMAFTAPLGAQEHAPANAEGVARETAKAGEAHPDDHGKPAPLLPSNLEEARQHFLAPAIWTIIIFVLMVAILYPTAWKNVLAGLKKREQRIRQDIADAEAARAKAEATLREYNQQLAGAEARVRELLNKAAADGDQLATSIRMQAQQEAEQIKERTNRDLEGARDAAMREFRQYAADVATSAAEKIIRRNLNAEDQQALVQESLEQLQTIER